MADRDDSAPERDQTRRVRGRFKPGQSGNPKGRPRKAASLAVDVERAMSEIVEIREDGRRRRITKRKAAAKRVANAGASGDLRAIKLYAELTAPAKGAAPAADAPLSEVEEDIFDRVVARIRQGWRPIDEGCE